MFVKVIAWQISDIFWDTVQIIQINVGLFCTRTKWQKGVLYSEDAGKARMGYDAGSWALTSPGKRKAPVSIAAVTLLANWNIKQQHQYAVTNAKRYYIAMIDAN